MNNLSSNFVNLKRKTEEPLEPGPAKKVCLEENASLFEIIPLDIIGKIFNSLSDRDLLVIDSVARKCSTFTKMQWQNRQKVQFSFSLYEKDSYLLSQAIDCYVMERLKIKVEENIQEKVKAIYQRFEGLMRRFPIFGAYIWHDLTHSFSSFTISQENQKLFEDHLSYLKDNSMRKEGDLKQEGGDYLLKGLYQVTCSNLLSPTPQHFDKQKYRIFECFKRAITEGSISASLYAYVLLKDKVSPEWLDSLAWLTEENHKDFRASDAIFYANLEFARKVYLQSLPRPSALSAMAFSEPLNTIKEELFDEAICLYEEKVPVIVLGHAANVKLHLNKWEEAEALFDKTLAGCGDAVPIQLLANASIAKLKVNKLKEAEVFCDRVLAFSGDDVSAQYLVRAVTIKSQLNKWKEAEILYHRVLAAYGDHLPPQLLSRAVIIKLRLNKWKEAEMFYNKVLAAYGDRVPAHFLVHAAVIKSQLNKWGDVEAICNKALTCYDDEDLPGFLLVYMAIAKQRLNKRQEAEILYNKVLAVYGDSFTKDAKLAYLAFLKLHFNKWEEAEELYNKAFAVYDNIPVAVLTDAAFVKLRLNKHQEAEALYDKALIIYGDYALADLLVHAAFVKSQLSKSEEAETLCNKALIACDGDVPADVQEMVDRVKERLNIARN